MRCIRHFLIRLNCGERKPSLLELFLLLFSSNPNALIAHKLLGIYLKKKSDHLLFLIFVIYLFTDRLIKS